MENLKVNNDVLNFNDTVKLVTYSIKANTPVHIIGPPGVGKTELMKFVARELNMELVNLILSIHEPTDIGGWPAVIDSVLRRLPLGPIKSACERPVLLFLDELSCAPPATQGAALQVIHERRCGDLMLHVNTRIAAASNPPDQAAGGWELALPLISRLTQIKMHPSLDEVKEYFYRLGEKGTTLHDTAVELAATLEGSPDLLQIHPPDGTQSSGKQWGSPRSWERAIRLASEVIDDGCKGSVLEAAYAGNIGTDQAAAYLNICALRLELPTIADVIADPVKCKVPQTPDKEIAALGVIARVGITDPCCAWIYTSRMRPEACAAAFRMLGRFSIKGHESSKWHKQATAAQKKILGQVGEDIRAV